MQIGKINSNINFKAKMSKNISKQVEEQGLHIWQTKGVDSRMFRNYQECVATINNPKMFPEGEICFENGKNGKIVLKHDGKVDIPLINKNSLFLAQELASGLKNAQRNIAKFLADKD